ncbi:chemotaxis protein methyltransferase CheR [Gammaproteobacteria bacterium]
MGTLALDTDRVFSNLTPFKEFIHRNCGLTFEHVGDGLLVRALNRRITALGLSGTYPETDFSYLALLQRDESEFQHLVSLITINETYFFREPEQLRLLTDTLIPRLLNGRAANQPIRIFSAGCSTGEEPYSIAMTLHEKFGSAGAYHFQITAGDLDQQAIIKAQEGRYSAFSFRGVDERWQRHFRTEDNGIFQIEPMFRNQVRFYHFNLLTDPYPMEFHHQDVIFFRNVSLYFDRNTRRTLQSRLADLLNHPGYLVVGTTETLSNDFGRLHLQGENDAYYFSNNLQPGLSPLPVGTKGFQPPAPTPARRLTPAKTAIDGNSAPPSPSLFITPTLPKLDPSVFLPLPPSAQKPVVADTIAPPPDFQNLLMLVQEKRYEQALTAIQKALIQRPDDHPLRHLKAHIHFHRCQLEEAEQEAQRILASQPWSLEAFLLLGKIHHYANRTKEAIRWFRQALYVQSGCWEAHYYLADLYRLTGQGAQAAREYRLVLKQITGTPLNHTETSLFPLAVPLTEVRTLCKHHLATLPLTT